MSNISLSGHDFWKTFCSVQTIDVWVADEEHCIWSYIWQKRMSPKQLCLVWYKLLKIFRVFNTKGWIGNGIWGSDLSCSLENTQILEKENSYKTREGKPCQTREVRTRIKPGKENRVKPERYNSYKTREGKPSQTREVRTRIKPGKENRVKPERLELV